MNRIGPLGLQPPLQSDGLLSGREPLQLLHIRWWHGHQVAQDQGGARAEGPVGHLPFTHGQFDLGQTVTGLQGTDQSAQGQQEPAHTSGQDGAAGHVGHVARLALMETHQHHALGRHMAHRQARAVAVGPGRALNRAQDLFSPHLGQVRQAVLQGPLLHSHLGTGLQVLDLAATTGPTVQAEVRTGRLHAQVAGARQLAQLALLPGVLAPLDQGTHGLAGQGTLDEDHLALRVVRHALAFQVQ
jgi:hypothetical protein